MTDDSFDQTAGDKYIVFQLGGEGFATPLIEVRGVIEYHAAKPIPHTAPFYKGVINVRGEILGVIDVRERLGVSGTSEPTCQLIFESEFGPLAATVDRVISVSIIEKSQIDQAAARDPAASAARPYFLGVARVGDQILTLVSLPRAVENVAMTRVAN